MALQVRQHYTKSELISLFVLFILLLAYIIIRAVTISLVHDEAVSLWAYMIQWNPFPYQGYIALNNHFLNSFLGGFFIRLFNSTETWVIRLPNILSFIIYYLAIVGLKPFFRNKFNFYYLLATLVFTPLLIEFMGMARGYGLSMAFIIVAIQQTQVYIQHKRPVNFILIQLSWILAVYSNLTLIVFAIAGMAYVTLIRQKRRQVFYVSGFMLSMLPILYLIKYIFYLKNLGGLDVGATEGFFKSTLHTLTPFIWNTKGLLLDLILVCAFIVIFIVVLINLKKEKSIFRNHILIPSFFILAVANIFIQNLLLDVGFPKNRQGVYLVVFFFLALFYSIDSITKSKWYGLPVALISLILFFPQADFNYIKLYYNEHFDEELFAKIPSEVEGIPVSTGGRFWATDDAYIRKNRLRLMAFQDTELPADTLTDYILHTKEISADLEGIYHPVHIDAISKVTLYERNKFLTRVKVDTNQIAVSGNHEFYDICRKSAKENPVFYRCAGVLTDMSVYKDVKIVFSAMDSVSGKQLRYEAVHITQNTAINDNREISFDFTYAMNAYSEANLIKIYLWNPYNTMLNGKLSLETYDINEVSQNREKYRN